MRNLKNLFIVLIFGFFAFASCTPEKSTQDSSVNLPDKFSVDIPSSINSGNGKKMATNDTISGGDLYEQLRTFVNIGEFSSSFVEEIMHAINKFNLAQSMSITYVSDDDGRTKSLDVVENPTFEGKQYAFSLTVKDSNDYAMQVFWNSNPVVGTAIVSPYNLDRTSETKYKDTKYRVDYSEAGEMGYEQHMIVYITGYPVEERFGLNNLKMFVGKNGDQVDIYGNSNHPKMWLLSSDATGYDWAFVARANVNTNISVAQVALPPMTLETTDSLFENYGIRDVMASEFHRIYDNIYPANLVEEYLKGILQNAEAPAYFSNKGFIAAGPANQPDNFSNDFINLSNLSPYVPKDIMNLNISFDTNRTAK